MVDGTINHRIGSGGGGIHHKGVRRLRLSSIAVVGVTAIGGLGAAGAGAKSTKPVLRLEEGGAPLASGAPIEASSSNFAIDAEGPKVSCQDTTLSGTVGTVENQKADTMQIAEGVFAGEAANEGLCTSTFAPPLKEAVVTATTFPWLETFTTKGQSEIKQQVIFRISPREIPAGSHGALSCEYSTKALKGSFVVNGESLSVTVTKLRLNLLADSSHQCARHASLSATFAYSSGGSPVMAVYG